MTILWRLTPAVFFPLVLLLSAAVADSATRYWNPRRGYAPFADSVPALLSADSVGTPPRLVSVGGSDSFTFSFRLSNLHAVPGKRYTFSDGNGGRRGVSMPGWEILAVGTDGGVAVSVTTAEGAGDGVSTRPVLNLRARRLADDTDIATAEITDGIGIFGERNIFELSRSGDDWRLCGGRHRQRELLSFSHRSTPTDSVGFRISPGGLAEVGHIRLITDEPPREADPLWPWSDGGTLEDALAETTDVGLAGVWRIYDREMDESLLRLGGDYTLAILPDAEGIGFDIVYLDGAVAGGGSWRRGDCKGHIAPSPFAGIYEVTWLDASREPLAHEIRGYLDSDGLLTVRFPYQNSVIRFGKIPTLR